MSSSSFSLLSCLLIFSLLPILSSAGRPCKALFVSYHTTTTTTTTTVSSDLTTVAPTFRFYAVYRIGRLFPRRPLHVRRHQAIPDRLGINSSALQYRAKDILIVVSGLLFVVGCMGATAATMYLVWSVLSAIHHGFYNESSFDNEESPKKMGYVKMAAAATEPVKDATKEQCEAK